VPSAVHYGDDDELVNGIGVEEYDDYEYEDDYEGASPSVLVLRRRKLRLDDKPEEKKGKWVRRKVRKKKKEGVSANGSATKS
jgi:hypothetical protein